MESLTERQQEVLEFIRDCIAAGAPPTIREIGAHFGIVSVNGVICHLTALEKKGYISRDPNKYRAIRLAGKSLREVVGDLLKCVRGIEGYDHIPAQLKNYINEVRKVYEGAA